MNLVYLNGWIDNRHTWIEYKEEWEYRVVKDYKRVQHQERQRTQLSGQTRRGDDWSNTWSKARMSENEIRLYMKNETVKNEWRRKEKN